MKTVRAQRVSARLGAPNRDKHEERREELINAATRLFFAMGYEGMSIRDLEIESGITRGSIYYYFGSKEEIYCGVVIAALERAVHDYLAFTSKYRRNPKRAITAIMNFHFEWFENERPLFDLLQRFFFGPTPGIKLDAKSLDKVDALVRVGFGAVQGAIDDGIQMGVFKCSDPKFGFMAMWGLLVTLPHMNDENERMRAVGRPRAKLYSDIRRFVLRSLGAE